MRPARRVDNSAVLVVPNVKARMEAQHYIPPLSLHDLLRESFTNLSKNPNMKCQENPLGGSRVLRG